MANKWWRGYREIGDIRCGNSRKKKNEKKKIKNNCYCVWCVATMHRCMHRCDNFSQAIWFCMRGNRSIWENFVIGQENHGDYYTLTTCRRPLSNDPKSKSRDRKRLARAWYIYKKHAQSVNWWWKPLSGENARTRVFLLPVIGFHHNLSLHTVPWPAYIMNNYK